MHILLNYASRSRPERFLEGLHNIIDMASDKENYTVRCCLDRDDASMFRDNFPTQRMQRELWEHEKKFEHVILDFGYSKSKIDAINRPIPDSIQWDILVNFSDDMRFTMFGYDQLIREGMRCNGPDIFLHYPDSTAKHMLPTMSIMDRAYYERDNYIYYPSYSSLFSDNEAMEVAQIRGRYIFTGQQIFDHYHPAYGLAQWDDQYYRQQAFWNEDELLYIYRKSKNFYLDEIKHPHPDHNRTTEAI